jgi:hypothetical protein
MMELKPDDFVRYNGPTDCAFRVTHGETYRVFGHYPEPPMKGWKPRDEVSIRVEDQRDDFGGVVRLAASHFEKVEAQAGLAWEG